jgi:hypothetical protein
MHRIDTDKDGKNPVMTSKVLEAAPKLREAVGMGPDPSKLPKIRKPSTVGIEKDSKPTKTEKPKDQPDEQRLVLQALQDLGGKDVHSMDIAKRLGFDKTHKNAPRAPVRNAMKALHALHFVTSKKEGAKFSFSITDKGKEALKDKHDPDDVPDHMLNEAHKAKQAKEAGSAPASAPERPANTDIECPKCHTFNPFMAEFCKECGTVLRQRIGTVVKAAQVAA